MKAVRRYRREGMTDPNAIRIITEDFNYAYQVLVEQRPVHNPHSALSSGTIGFLGNWD